MKECTTDSWLVRMLIYDNAKQKHKHEMMVKGEQRKKETTNTSKETGIQEAFFSLC